jgi:hypothetical protein
MMKHPEFDQMVALAERLRLELDSSDRKNLVGSQIPAALIGHLEKKQVASMHPHGPDPICDIRRNVGFYQARLFLCQWQLMPSLLGPGLIRYPQPGLWSFANYG